MPKSYYTYIVASRSHTLYIGFTSNIEQRIWQHKNKAFEGFSSKYNCNRLVCSKSTAVREQPLRVRRR